MSPEPRQRYRGRFAPTPSGPLHFGSLVAALASRLDALAHAGDWLLRLEDVDPPRVVPGAADAILRTLEAHGFEWDGPIIRQSRRGEAYADALEQLRRLGVTYACACSRKQLGSSAQRGVDGPVYPGTCRQRGISPAGHALRLRVPPGRLAFEDRTLGRIACNVAAECGDFVLRRADGVYTYQLAVVVDDAAQGITDVVRGADLLTSTPRQRVLQDYLALPPPRYLHLPVALDARGDKLSKQTLATPLDATRPLAALTAAADFLGLPTAPADATLADFWHWATAVWADHRPRPIRGARPR